MRTAIAALSLLVLPLSSPIQGAEKDDPLSPWREGVVIKQVAPGADRHTIHSYFNTSPESLDGSKVVYFSSPTREGQRGHVCIRDRATGEEKALSPDFDVEDAHRVACQQWVSNGKRVVYHGERDGEWQVIVYDLDAGKERVGAHGQLSCWGRPDMDLVPLYSPHWNPGTHRDLDLLNVATGEIKTVLTLEQVKQAYPDWYEKNFGGKITSIFFPILSPGGSRIFFKMAVAGNGDPRSKGASERQGLVCYSLAEKRFLYMHEKWGHPSWHPDGRTIVEAGNLRFDSNDGSFVRVPNVPFFSGDHPSASPDGKLVVTDTTMNKIGGKQTDWGIVLFNPINGDYLVLDQFDNSHGATSWRRSHPHPAFSADGKRIYFNVSSGPWTQLHVAERQK
jgi:Tol biopolymer transport system component